MYMYMEIVCDKDQTQYCIKRKTLFGFQFDQLNLWASYYFQETLNPKVKVLLHWNERKKSLKTNKEKQKTKNSKNENWLEIKIHLEYQN